MTRIMRHKFLYFLLITVLPVSAMSQVVVNQYGFAMEYGAILELTSDTKGFLPPRLSSIQRSTLATSLNAAQTGMQVMDATSGTAYTWNGSAWVNDIYNGVGRVG